MRLARRTALLLVIVAACAGAALATGVVSKGGASASAAGSCQLGTKAGQVKHVVYLQFDNTHFVRDNPNVPSDLEQMPHLLNFLKDNGTLLSNDHTILISHTAGGILSSLTGLYPDRNGQTVSNSYGYFKPDGSIGFPTSFKYWTDIAAFDDPLPNMVGDGGQTAPAPWTTYTQAGCNVGGVSAANIELENNAAIFAPTTLGAAAAAGAASIKVRNATGFANGMPIVLGNAANPDPSDQYTITSVSAPDAAGLVTIGVNPVLTKAYASGTQAYGPTNTDPSGDMTRVFGANSPEWLEGRASQIAPSGTAARNLALTDFVGIAIHCAPGDALCQTGNQKPDDTTINPGSNNGSDALFGARYVNPVIGSTNNDQNGRPCIKATDGTDIKDTTNQCGFPGFDGALAKNTLGEVAAMQEHGVPVTFAYISDAHDDHVTATASGPGEARYKQQLADYDTAFEAFFTRLKNDGIDKSNTLFIVTVDEGDHFAGGTGLPDQQNPGALTYVKTPCAPATQTCPSNQMGEITTNLKGLLPAGEPPFSVHNDDAPTIYVNGNPPRTDANVRKLGRDISVATAIDPYKPGGQGSVPITEKLADSVGEAALHMVNSDPRRTPTLTLFGNDDFFFQTSNSFTCSPQATECVDSKFAWNHGDNQPEIANTWIGMVGPGVDTNGVDGNTWTDHVDVRPTILALLGLSDSYVDDGRVITQIVSDKAAPKTLDKHDKTVEDLGAIYKQVNAPFGSFSQDLLTASTTALGEPDTTAGNLKYDSIESKIADLTSQRNTLAGTIRQALNDAAKGVAAIDKGDANAWITQAQSLIDQAHALSQTAP
jgi:hypothetical protein